MFHRLTDDLSESHPRTGPIAYLDDDLGFYTNNSLSKTHKTRIMFLKHGQDDFWQDDCSACPRVPRATARGHASLDRRDHRTGEYLREVFYDA